MKRRLAAVLLAAAIAGCTSDQQSPTAETVDRPPMVAGVTDVPASASTSVNSSTSANTPVVSQQQPQTISTLAPPPVEGDEVVATVRGDPITLKQIEGPLLESHGPVSYTHLERCQWMEQFGTVPNTFRNIACNLVHVMTGQIDLRAIMEFAGIFAFSVLDNH